jgi:hypothetical protein
MTDIQEPEEKNYQSVFFSIASFAQYLTINSSLFFFFEWMKLVQTGTNKPLV